MSEHAAHVCDYPNCLEAAPWLIQRHRNVPLTGEAAIAWGMQQYNPTRAACDFCDKHARQFVEDPRVFWAAFLEAAR